MLGGKILPPGVISFRVFHSRKDARADPQPILCCGCRSSAGSVRLPARCFISESAEGAATFRRLARAAARSGVTMAMARPLSVMRTAFPSRINDVRRSTVAGRFFKLRVVMAFSLSPALLASIRAGYFGPRFGVCSNGPFRRKSSNVRHGRDDSAGWRYQPLLNEGPLRIEQHGDGSPVHDFDFDSHGRHTGGRAQNYASFAPAAGLHVAAALQCG